MKIINSFKRRDTVIENGVQSCYSEFSCMCNATSMSHFSPLQDVKARDCYVPKLREGSNLLERDLNVGKIAPSRTEVSLP